MVNESGVSSWLDILSMENIAKVKLAQTGALVNIRVEVVAVFWA
ncbi:hypothetical protein DSBG_4507 [Desulfosporosinus sp. BG]|nr:hypothetical protein DSBG_4507 [Desulfosporosinus sp. BG]